MFTARRCVLAPWPLPLALLLAACGGPEEAVRGCARDADCGAGGLCVQSACVTNRPPVVTLQLPAALATHRVERLSATATDPDAGDSLAGFTWTITPVGAACPAEPEPGAGPWLELVFWCAGTYEVAVVAEDRQGGRSAPARQLVEVGATSGAPEVTAGPGLSVDHACGGTPFACRPALAGSPVPLPLTAAVTDPSGAPFTARWRMFPPAGVDPGATVTYSSGETSLFTEAWVRTPGGLVAGTWRFRLRATSAAGLVGQAEQLVQVGNRPPVLGVEPFRLDHRHEGGSYLAGGALALPAADPDGDPISLTVALVEVGTTGCQSQLGPVMAGSVAFETRCDDPARLIGLGSRSLHVTATDGSGASTEAILPIEIGNRPPVLRLASDPAGGLVSVGHSVGPCPGASGSCFLAEGTASFQVEDPDGDPVTATTVEARFPAALGASTGETAVAGGLATFRFATAVSAPGEFRAADGTSPFSLLASAADPFGARSSLAVPILVGNRPPVPRTVPGTVVVPHRYDRAAGAYLASAALGSFEDPDGDPLQADGSLGHGPCATFSFTGGDGQVECVLPYTPAPGLPPLAALVGDHPVVLRAFDGWEAATSSTTVNVQNGAPSGAEVDQPLEACTCACPDLDFESGICNVSRVWMADTTFVRLDVRAADADGDPVQVSYDITTAGGDQRTVFPEQCSSLLIEPYLPITVQVTIDDGVGLGHTSSTVRGVTCALQGQTCR